MTRRSVAVMSAGAILVAVSFAGRAAENAAPADELSRSGKDASAAVPVVPEGYRRPRGWKPVLYPKTLRQIARDHSQETMERAKAQMAKVDAVNAAGRYKATGVSMDSHPCPEWFIDAKFGIFIDWGLWSLASWCPYVKGARLYPDWYEFRCDVEYPEGHAFHGMKEYHEKNWGADFKRDHFIDLFRGAKFDAPVLAGLFVKCGARYVVPFLKHHSGFCLWDCSYTFRDSVDQGAHRDFAREMSDACRAHGLKFGVYTSQAGEWEYPILQDDGSVRIWKEASTMVDCTPDMEWKASGKIAVKDFVRDYIVPQTTEFIDKYDPDILWYDYDWATFAHENGSYDITAYFYNRAEGRKEVACNDRYGKGRPEEVKGRGKLKVLRTVRGDFFTDEWGDTEEFLDPAKWHPWESCSGISKAYGNHWQETADMVMSEREFVIHFADIVSRGGNLLLLVNLDPQGAIPAVQRERLMQIGKWLSRYGEAIYATRILAPFSTPDIDYTQSKDGSTAYAIVKNPSSEIMLRCKLPAAVTVTLVGDSAPLRTERTPTGLKVALPPSYASATVPFALKMRASGRGKRDAIDFKGLFPPDVKTIGIVSVSSLIPTNVFTRGTNLLVAAGYRVKVMPNVLKKEPPEVKARLFEQAWLDPEIDFLLFSRGGQGAANVITRIDWERLRGRNMRVLGFSDVTVVLGAMLSKGVGVPISGPSLSTLSTYNTRESRERLAMMLHGTPPPIQLTPVKPCAAPVGGKSFVGVLERFIVLSKLGYLPSFDGRVIFIEGISKYAADSESALERLRAAGAFDKAAAVVFCDFNRKWERTRVEALFTRFAEKVPCPVFSGYPYGHVPRSFAIDCSRPLRISPTGLLEWQAR